MKIGLTTFVALGLAAGGVTTISVGTATALPLSGSGLVAKSGASPKIETVRYRCGYYGCRRPVYGYYYRPYRYGYYGPRYYRPYVGVGIGGFGLGLY